MELRLGVRALPPFSAVFRGETVQTRYGCGRCVSTYHSRDERYNLPTLDHPPETQTVSALALEKALYSASDPRDAPRYSCAQAAHYLFLPKTTVAYWIRGGSYQGGYFQQVVERPDPDDPRLSFWNLVELHIIHGFRRKHKIPMRAIRDALLYAQAECDIDRLLLHKDLCAAPGRLFLEQFRKLINLGQEGQLAMVDVLDQYLDRLEWERDGLVSRLFPATRETFADSPRVVVIDPRIAFGRPMLDHHGVKTATIAARFEAGESVRFLAGDYDLKASEVEEAIRYEKRAA